MTISLSASAAAEQAFADLRGAFTAAANRCAGSWHESYHHFGGKPVHVRVAGRGLGEYLTRPFAHLGVETVPGPPSLRIEVWDEQISEVSCPPHADPALLDTTRPVDGGLFGVSSDHRFLAYGLPESLTWLDRHAGHLIGWRAAAVRLSLHERAKPFPLLLSAWYRDHGIYTIHAGLVAHGGRGVLFAGASGVGKSTCALACVLAGWDYLGDDFVGLQVGPQGCLGHSLYASARVAPHHLQRFPELCADAIAGTTADEPKSLVFPAEHSPERVRQLIPIDLLLLPSRVDQATTAVRRTSKAEALRTLVSSSFFAMIPSPGRRGVECLAHLVNSVPTYWLDMGRDIRDIPRRVADVLCGAPPR